MSKLFDKVLMPNIILCFLVLIGAILRICSLWGPLSHDEVSAIVRLNYDTFSELIDYGVRGDGHPAGVQVFLWLWCKVFGTSAIAIRIPFVLMGIATIPLVYLIGRRWYGEWPALLPTAVIAVTQFTVYYSVIARPYIAGLFLLLCLLYIWTRILIQKDYKWYMFVFFALLMALCAYTHYFCMLSALLLMVAGVLFLDNRYMWYYLGAIVGAILLFLPHLGITSHQLLDLQGIGGEEGWLDPPTPVFMLEFVRYLFHFSWIVIAVAIIGYLLVFSLKDARQHLKLMVVALLIFLVQFLTGYLYSVNVNPVLQYSSLIFVFPFLSLALAGGVDSQDRKGRQALVLLVYCAAMVLSLIFTRKHFQMIKHDYLEIIAQEEKAAIDRYGADNVMCIVDIALAKLQYYDPSLYSLPQSAIEKYSTFDSVLTASPTPYLFCSRIADPKLLDIAKHHYPYLLSYRECFTTEVYLFGRKPSEQAIDLEKTVIFEAQKDIPRFEEEYYNVFDITVGDYTDSRFVCVSSQLVFHKPDSMQNSMHLVVETLVNDRKVDWHETETSDVCFCEGDTCEVCIPVRLETWIKHRSQLKKTHVKVYLWNPNGKNAIEPISCSLKLYPTNPFVYSVLEEI